MRCWRARGHGSSLVSGHICFIPHSSQWWGRALLLIRTCWYGTTEMILGQSQDLIQGLNESDAFWYAARELVGVRNQSHSQAKALEGSWQRASELVPSQKQHLTWCQLAKSIWKAAWEPVRVLPSALSVKGPRASSIILGQGLQASWDKDCSRSPQFQQFWPVLGHVLARENVWTLWHSQGQGKTPKSLFVLRSTDVNLWRRQ